MSKSPAARFTTRISVLSPDGSCTVTSSGSREPAANFTVIDFTALAIAGSFGTMVYESPEVPETPKTFSGIFPPEIAPLSPAITSATAREAGMSARRHFPPSNSNAAASDPSKIMAET